LAKNVNGSDKFFTRWRCRQRWWRTFQADSRPCCRATSPAWRYELVGFRNPRRPWQPDRSPSRLWSWQSERSSRPSRESGLPFWQRVDLGSRKWPSIKRCLGDVNV